MAARPSRDVALLFATRILRLFAYGFLSVVLVLYLAAGRAVPRADRPAAHADAARRHGSSRSGSPPAPTALGRRRMLLLGAVLMVFAGVLFAVTHDLLRCCSWPPPSASSARAATRSARSWPSSRPRCPQIVPAEQRTRVFAWYNLVGSFATALGALAGGVLAQVLQHTGAPALASYRAVVVGYAVLGAALLVALRAAVARPSKRPPRGARAAGRGTEPASACTARAESCFRLSGPVRARRLRRRLRRAELRRLLVPRPLRRRAGRARRHLLRRQHPGRRLGAARPRGWPPRFGLINTMVFTHIPSNVLLMLVPLMPTLPLAVAMLLLRFSISQMDVPTRQSYTMAVVSPDERSAAAGVTGIARTIGAALSPLWPARSIATPALASVPFFLAGGLKIVYDLLLWRDFRRGQAAGGAGRG